MELYSILRDRLRRQLPTSLVTVIEGPRPGAKLLVTPDGATLGSLGNSELDRIAARDALAELEAGRSGVRHYGPDGETTPEDLENAATVSVFVESWAPPPEMLIFGAVDFTAALSRVAKVLGYRVTVIDAREVFATRRRFPAADEVVVSWPTPVFTERGPLLRQRDAVCILTHDPKFDVPAVIGALATSVGYIGVMGSRTTHDKRTERLIDAGLSPSDLGRLMSPIGLDLGARTPEETAISICAEIIATRTGRVIPSLRDAAGPIHRGPPAPPAADVPRAGPGTRCRPDANLGSGSRVAEAEVLLVGDHVHFDVVPGLSRVDDCPVDAQPHHDVAGVLHQISGLGGLGHERRRSTDLRRTRPLQGDPGLGPRIGGDARAIEPDTGDAGVLAVRNSELGERADERLLVLDVGLGKCGTQRGSLNAET